MALTIPGLSADLLSKLKSGDSAAFETLFRAAYPLLVAKAKEVLTDDAAAARVVERIMPSLFAERATLTTPEALGDMLDGATHEAAVRENSRLAGLRKHGDVGKRAAPATAPTVDQAWSRVEVAIRGPSEESHEAAHKARAARAHEAASHIKMATKGTSWIWQVVGVLGLTGVVALGIVLYQQQGEVQRVAGEVTGNQVRELKTGTGQRGNVMLDDSTNAQLGSDTRVAVPLNFAEKVRAVGLQGAAEFTVKTNVQPFWIIAKNVHIAAVGGETFAIRAFPKEDMVIVRSKTGSVEVNVLEPKESSHTLAAGQSILIGKDGTTSQPTAQQLADALGYLEGTFSVTDQTLNHTLEEVRRWYGIDLALQDTTLGTRKVTLTAPLTSSTEAIKAIENAAGLAFAWEKQRMTLVEKPK